MDRQCIERLSAIGTEMKEALKVPEVAKALGIHPATLRRWCLSGRGPQYFRSPGGAFLFRPEAITAWISLLEGTEDKQ